MLSCGPSMSMIPFCFRNRERRCSGDAALNWIIRNMTGKLAGPAELLQVLVRCPISRRPHGLLKQRRSWGIAVTPRLRIGAKWLQLQCLMVLRRRQGGRIRRQAFHLDLIARPSPILSQYSSSHNYLTTGDDCATMLWRSAPAPDPTRICRLL